MLVFVVCVLCGVFRERERGGGGGGGTPEQSKRCEKNDLSSKEVSTSSIRILNQMTSSLLPSLIDQSTHFHVIIYYDNNCFFNFISFSFLLLVALELDKRRAEYTCSPLSLTSIY